MSAGSSAFVDLMKAVLYNGLADYNRAAAAADDAVSANEIMNANGALPELVEAAVRSGQPDRAAAALARALLADGDVADELYGEAIELLSHTRMATFLARARLCYGEWLRRTDGRSEASTQLRAAFDA